MSVAGYLDKPLRSLLEAMAARMKDCPECEGLGWYEGYSSRSIRLRCTECGGSGKVEKSKFDE